MTTDNRTNEQIVAEAIYEHSMTLSEDEQAVEVVEALRAANRLAGEPSEHFHIWSGLPCKPGQCRMEPAPVQPSSTVDEVAIERAAKALAGISWETPWSDCDVWGDRDEWVNHYRERAHAVVEAIGGESR